MAPQKAMQTHPAVWLSILAWFMLQLYQEFGVTYKHWFEFLLPRSNQKLLTGQHPSNRSFKIVAECPVIGMTIYAAHMQPMHSCAMPCSGSLPAMLAAMHTLLIYMNDKQAESMASKHECKHDK